MHALKSVTIPNSVTSIGKKSFENCEELTAINVDTKNVNYASVDGVLFNKDKSILILFPSGKTGFYNIPNSVTSIGESAFYSTNLLQINLPKTIKNIGASALYGATDLMLITSAIEKPNTVNLGNNVFENMNFNTCKVLVPEASKSDYKSANQWKQFQHVIDSSDLNYLINISFAEKTKTLFTDEEYQLNLIFYPSTTTSRAVFWESSDSTVATVSQKGKIKALKKGKAVITATSVDNDSKAKFTVIVKEDKVGKEFKVNNITYKLIESSPLAVRTIKIENIQNKKVTIPDEVTYQKIAYKVKEVGGNFIKSIYLDTLVIKEGVEKINKKAFQDGNVKVMYLPKSMKQIEKNAFSSTGINRIVSKIEQPENVVEKYAFANNTLSNAILEIPGGTRSRYQQDAVWRKFQNFYVKLDSFKFFDEKIILPIDGYKSCHLILYPADATYSSIKQTFSPTNYTGIISLSYNQIISFLVKAKGKGKATITATSNEVPNFKAEMEITVDDELVKFAKDGLYYIITKKDEPREVELIKRWTNAQALPSGEVVVSEEVEHDGKKYKVTSVANSAFANCPDLKSITLPNTIKHMDKNVFFECSKLESIRLPNSLTRIASYSFQNCTSLKSLTIPNGVTEIESSSFENCTSLKSLTIPNGVTKIGRNSFKNCTSLQRIVIPKNVTEIEASAFYGCKGLRFIQTQIQNPDDVLIGSQIFEKVSKKDCRLYVPSRTKEIYKSLAQWRGFNQIIIRVSDVKISDNSLSIKQEETATLTATVVPEDADNTNIFWKSNDIDIAEVSKGVITAKKIGTVTISAVSEDGDFRAVCEVTVTPKLGVNDMVKNEEFSIYPSIVSNHFTVESKHVNSTLAIYHLTGKKVYEQVVHNKKEEIDISYLKSGVYMIKINNKIAKIVKE